MKCRIAAVAVWPLIVAGCALPAPDRPEVQTAPAHDVVSLAAIETAAPAGLNAGAHIPVAAPPSTRPVTPSTTAATATPTRARPDHLRPVVPVTTSPPDEVVVTAELAADRQLAAGITATPPTSVPTAPAPTPQPAPTPTEPPATTEVPAPTPEPSTTTAPPATTAPPTTTAAPATTTTVAAPAPSSDSSAEAQFAASINQLRAGVGVPALARNGDLDARARGWAEYMATTGDFRHSSVINDLVGAGWSTAGENIGYGPSVASVYGALEASSGHYANMVNASFTSLGVGVYVDSSGTVWTAHLFAG